MEDILIITGEFMGISFLLTLFLGCDSELATQKENLKEGQHIGSSMGRMNPVAGPEGGETKGMVVDANPEPSECPTTHQESKSTFRSAHQNENAVLIKAYNTFTRGSLWSDVSASTEAHLRCVPKSSIYAIQDQPFVASNQE